MNTEKKIEQCLRAAPKPVAPERLLNKLRQDVVVRQSGAHDSILRSWFAPTGERISFWRVAAAVAIAIAVLLPLTYGVAKIVKVYTIRIESRRVNNDGTITATKMQGQASGFADEEEAKRVWQETRELKKAGKYERTFEKEIESNGVKYHIYNYRYTLSNRQVVNVGESERVEKDNKQ
jgi:hypothetical protein